MGYRGMQNVPVHRYLYEVSVVPYRPSDKKTTTFSLEYLRKTLSQICNVKGVTPLDTTKLSIFQKRTTLTQGIA